MDHLGTGGDWDLDRKRKGLYVLPPYISSSSVDPTGNGEDLSGLLDFFRGNSHKYVIISDSNVVFNSRMDGLVQAHEDSGADITVLYNRDGNRFGSPATILNLDRRGQVRDVMQDPAKPASSACSLGVLVMDRELLVDQISESVARGEREFSIGGLLRRYGQYTTRGLEYKKLVLRINNVPTYFNASLRLLEEGVQNELFWSGLPVYTKVKDEAPAQYGDANHVRNSAVSDGCTILGTSEDSIIFRGVTLAARSMVRRCVIMQDSLVSEDAQLENVILDKNCVIRPGVRLVGQREYPVVIGKGAIV
jgi:glucose-1-phosphate adenylyltransferase